VASLAGVGLFAETHAGTMARRIAVVPLSDAGPALASVAVIFEAVPEVLDFNEMCRLGHRCLRAPSRSSPHHLDHDGRRDGRWGRAPGPRPQRTLAQSSLSRPAGWTVTRRPDGRRNSGQEIATIIGHSLRDVRSILDAHYLHRDW